MMAPDHRVWATRLNSETLRTRSGAAGPYVQCIMWAINSPFFPYDIEGNNDAIIVYDAIGGAAASYFILHDNMDVPAALHKAAQMAEIGTPHANT